MDKFDAKLFLSGLKTKNILFVEHWKGDATGDCAGRFYAITDKQGLLHITHQLLTFMEIENFYTVKHLRLKTGVPCIRVKDPITFMRDVSEELYGRWNEFNVAILEKNNVF